MNTHQVAQYLDDAQEAGPWLKSIGVSDADRAHGNLRQIATGGLPIDLMTIVCRQLADYLPATSDADMAVNNLERFVSASLSPLSLGGLFERDPEALPILLRIFSTSQHLSDLLILDPAGYDLLRMTDGQPVHRDVLVEELCAEIDMLDDDLAVATALRRFKRRETLRISYGDIIRQQRLEVVTAQISYLADAVIEAAVRHSRRMLEQKRGVPQETDGSPARFVVLGMGKLGGTELNYSSDIDLICLYDGDGKTDGERPVPNGEFFEHVARKTFKLLNEPTEIGVAYRVDLRLRPEGSRGPLVVSRDAAERYYDTVARTWERQAFVKARPVAGDLEFGASFLKSLEPWIYRRYLNRADIVGIKTLKRRIEERTLRDGANELDVKTGHGGIRDIEFAIQFLQLLNGGDLPKVRVGNTLEAIAQLEAAGCLTHQERNLLVENYCFLRKLEHLLQGMFDLQTHLVPEEAAERAKLAIRMGYVDNESTTALAQFEAEFQEKKQLNRKILDHLLHDAFGHEDNPEPEVDLVLDPDPPSDKIAEVLGRYGFSDIDQAYQNLMELADEKIRFLSTRRCRFFLASIAPRLLAEIGDRPDPDSTLLNLCQVSDSLGGKGVLWEMFSFAPATLRMYVDLCATSPYLSSILTSNPGMIDELMDSLVLDKLPRLEQLEEMLSDLARAAEDPEPILHSFKNTQQLRVGVRDILGKEPIEATTAALSDIAQACLARITRHEYAQLTERLGTPTIGTGPRGGEPCELAIVAMGKFGGRELNYRSDLDIVFLYEADGATHHTRPSRRSAETTTNQHFFGELGQRVIKVASRLGPFGRLYEVDARLRPTGRNGPLATSFEEFARYFESGEGQLWERMALCRARVCFGSPEVRETLDAALRHAALDHPWRDEVDLPKVLRMRKKLQDAATPHSVKRGRGGIVDVEFLAQALQLKHGRQWPEVRETCTPKALKKLCEAGLLDSADYEFFAESYRTMRKMNARLQLMNSSTRDMLPTDSQERNKLAHALGYSSGQALVDAISKLADGNRARLERILGERVE